MATKDEKRWVCENCGAVHHYAAKICGNAKCQGQRLKETTASRSAGLSSFAGSRRRIKAAK